MTVAELLRQRAAEQGDQIAYLFIREDGTETKVSYRELDQKARQVAAFLQAQDAVGERALLLYPPGIEYITAFFACLYAGVIAVPAYPPRANGNLGRLQAVVQDADAKLALTTSAILASVKSRFREHPELQNLDWLVPAAELDGMENAYRHQQIAGDDLAFLQYTSGSTSLPKGVMLSHRNLLHNLELIENSFGTSPQDRCVIWLPPYHDMGLIGGILQPLFTGYPVTLMAPVDFIQKPFKWLETISRTQASVSGGPNFAYELCLQKITPEQRDALDLSAWEVAFTGAEPIRAETIERFADYFTPCGFRKEAFYPCYGLAEGTLFVSGGQKSEVPVVRSFDRELLKENRAVSDGDQRLVSSGQLRAGGQQVLIVDAQERTCCQDGQVGEIWVSGSSVAKGYWRRPEQTEETFAARLQSGEGPYLRTGDLGFVLDGELYVTGRQKDMVIIRGRNYYPQDVEFAVQSSHPAVKNSNGAAFAVEVGGEERLVVVQEIERAYRKADLEAVVRAVRQQVAAEHELQTHAIVLLKPVSIPKTSSGKVQRHLCRERYLQGTLDAVYLSRLGEADSAEQDVAATRSSDQPASLDRNELLALSKEEARAALIGYLTAQAEKALRLAGGTIDPSLPLSSLGMDSIAAVELQHLVEAEFGVALALSDLLDDLTVSALAANVLSKLTDGTSVEAELNERANSDAVMLSEGQRALWYLQRYAPESAAYNIARAVRLSGRHDADALRHAFEKLVERHPLLRSQIAEQDGEPVFLVQPSERVPFLILDATAWTEGELHTRLQAEADRPFDLEQEFPVRALLFLRSAQQAILLLNAHHIVSDFWSFGVMVKELQTLYAGEELPAPQRSFAEHVREEKAMLGGARGRDLRNYWIEQLQGRTAALNLPTDFSRPAEQTFDGSAVPFRLSAELTERLRRLAQEQKVTLQMVLLAAFQVLLHRYTGQEELVVGTPTTGRNSAKNAGLIGYFVNPVIMRADFAERQSFSAFLQQVRRTVLGALAHQEYPYPLLAQELGKDRDPSDPPLVQVMFTYQKSHLAELGADFSTFALGEGGAQLPFGDLTLEAIELEQRFVQVDLALSIADTADELIGRIEYNAGLFLKETAVRMTAHLTTLLTSIAADGDRPIATLELLTEREKEHLLTEWNDKTAPYPHHLTAMELFDQQVLKTPEDAAVVFQGHRMSYRELGRQADRLAAHLRAKGVVTGLFVGYFGERNLDWAVAVLAIFKAGGIYVPLDPKYPIERLTFMIEDTTPQVMLTYRDLVDKLPPHDSHILCLDEERDGGELVDEERVQGAVTPDDVAYVIFTSGSTGRPKGAQVEHKGMLNHLLAKVDELEMTPADRIAQNSSQCVDISVWQLLTGWMIGAETHILPDEVAFDPARQLDEMEATELTIVETVPSLLRAMIEEVAMREAVPDLSALRWMIPNGEVLPPELCRKWLAFYPQAWLINAYGPTECSDDVTHHFIKEPPGEEVTNVPIGRVIPNMKLYILDAEMQLVPIGVPGELHIGGIGVGPGYLKNEERTAQSFLPDHISGIRGARLYKTGDLVRLRHDGLLEFLGRIDNQVKIRGFRIEIGEIETVIAKHPSVLETVVVARVVKPGDKRLAAYLVVKQEERPTPRELRNFVREKLPEHMVPSAFVLLDAMPLTANGKINRRALPEPDYAQLDVGSYTAPRTPLEQKVAAIWADVLGVERIGVHDHFLLLGGHSLLAAQVVSRTSRSLGVQVPLRTLFEALTVAEFAEKLAGLLDAQGEQRAPIVPIDRSANLPLSSSQQRLWMMEQMNPQSAFYNIPHALRLRGALDRQALLSSLQSIVDRHEVLRTTYREVDGQAVREVSDSFVVALPTLDLSGLAGSAREAEIGRLAEEHGQKHFDLARGPLIACSLLRLAEEEHVLLFNVHHIAFDGWSVSILIEELVAHYEAVVQGAEPVLAQRVLQYADYAAWQKRRLQEPAVTEQLDYWKERLAGELPVLQLPLDRARPPVQTHEGATERFVLEAPLAKRLHDLSLRHGVTLFMTMLGAFQALLARYSGQEDLLVGTPIAGRHTPETEGMIGFFVNTLVMRTDLSGDPTFAELLERVKETALGAYEHDEVPFETLVEELQPERNRSVSPLFQAMFVLQNAPTAELRFEGLSVERMHIETHTAKYDLTLALEEGEDGIRGEFEFNTRLFDRATILRMVGHYTTLLHAVLAEERTPISTLQLLTEAEREQLLVEWNRTERDYPAELCIHQLFEAQAAKRPEHPAVIYREQALSYGELNARANRLARKLQAAGVGPESVVGLLIDRSPELLTAMLAVLKAGGAYLPLDPAYPKERLAYMIDDASPTRIVTRRHHLASLSPLDGTSIMLLDDQESGKALDEADHQNAVADVQPNHLAYIIYTSGSTGRPKGVMIEHRGVVNLITEPQLLFDADSRVLQFFSCNFDASVHEIFTSLSVGATLVMAHDEVRMPGQEMIEFLRQQQVTHVDLPPSVLTALPEADLPKIRVLTTGGEACTSEILTRWSQGRILLNQYGPTEATVTATMSRYESVTDSLLPDIGRPLQNKKAYILDRNLQPVPIGVQGELHIGGVGIARGYLNRPDLTAEKFINNPFAAQEQERLYKTGDLVRWLPNGRIEFLGRADDQVKLRGFRIELGEIEAVLHAHPSIAQSAVIVAENERGDKVLVAYLSCKEGCAVDGAELRAYAQVALPEHMIPSSFVFLDALPLNRNGKVDRRALPKLTGEVEEPTGRLPASDAEVKVAAVFCEVLSLQRVSAEDNFFERGGHSLLATQVITRLQAAFDMDIPLRTLFQAPTVEELAKRLQAEASAGRTSPALLTVSRDESLPLSYAQQRLWVLEQLAPGTALYNMPGTVRLQGELNREALRHSLQKIVDRHEALRTSFETVDGQVVQRIAERSPVKLTIVDARQATEEAVLRLLREEMETPFDLTVGPLVRFRLVETATDDHLLVLNMHHIVSDGWSMGIFVREFAALYEGIVTGSAVELPALAIQYADYSVWQRNWLDSGVLEGQLTYWKATLDGLTVLQLPTDRQRPPVQSHAGASERFVLSAELTEQLHAIGQQHDVTLYMTLLAAFQTLLMRYSGQEDIAVGSPIAGRNQLATENLIGFFVNTLVMRTDLSGRPTFAELLGRVKETALSAYAHQDVPFERLVEELQPERDLSRPPLVQTVFALQNAPFARAELPGMVLTPLELEEKNAKFDLTLSMEESDGRLTGMLEYATDLYDRATVQRLIGHFETMLQAIAADPSMQITQLPLLTPAEEHLLVNAWNDSRNDYPRDRCIHQLFEEQAEETPDAIALTFEGEHMTYHQLDQQANRLARHLQKQGVAPRELVGLAAERSFEMIIGMLAILKAGGALVALDPNYPEERLSYLMRDSGIRVLLTQPHLVDRLPEHDVQIIMLAEERLLADESSERIECQVTADDLLHVIYTSGSTGQPKGVMVTHRGLVRLFRNNPTVGYRQGEVAMQFSSISFDAAGMEIWGSLLNGMRLVLFPPYLPSLAELGTVIRDEQVTLLFLTTALFHQLIDERIDDLHHVKQFIIGGEAMSALQANKVVAQLPDCRLTNLYGPAEGSIYATAFQVHEAKRPLQSVPIGNAVASAEAYVLDAHQQLLPVGVPGELYIGGDGVALGYLNQPDLTAERFLPHFDRARQAERLYRTGDAVRRLPDGNIEFLGRLDHQVKIRGFRIELSEIESVIGQHDSVLERIVIAREGRLVAYVVTVPGTSLTGAELRTALKSKLPGYMIPSAFVLLDALPLTQNGKVDRRALPEPDNFSFGGTEEYTAPRTATERKLAAIWQDVLNLEQVSVFDSFFELGGHSLLATQAISRVNEAFHLQLPLRALFEAQSVAALAEAIESIADEKGEGAVQPIVPIDRSGKLICSFNQERVWMLDRMDPGTPAYNIPSAMRLTGKLDVDALERSFNEIVNRHESLRTAFGEEETGVFQRVIPSRWWPFVRHDLRELPAEQREAEAKRLLSLEVETNFDLTVGPMFSTILIQLGEEDYIWSLTIHHIITDGWSMGVFSKEMSALYEAFTAGKSSPLPELPVQFADYSAWQRNWLQGEVLARKLDYWVDQLKQSEAPQIRTDFPRPEQMSKRGKTIQFDLSVELTERLNDLSAQLGVTLYMTLISAYHLLLSRLSGQDDILVGSPVANRYRKETEEMIGYFIGNVPMRGDLSGDPTVSELFQRVRTSTLGAYEHQMVPQYLISNALERKTALYNALFILQNMPISEISLPGVTSSMIEPDMDVSKFDMTITMIEMEGRLQGYLEFSTDLFLLSTAERLMGQYQEILLAFAEDPTQRISQIRVL
ncbi:amino acid adenylation domain-containing protein [Tumebacillus lipolyticus]|uniref:Amino acid adenylation domain-containing protein n=1 Tax=Tumebacillus lipolyticus TaxID=1280370 RepID=A0ABW4ZSJ8_9BACL